MLKCIFWCYWVGCMRLDHKFELFKILYSHLLLAIEFWNKANEIVRPLAYRLHIDMRLDSCYYVSVARVITASKYQQLPTNLHSDHNYRRLRGFIDRGCHLSSRGPWVQSDSVRISRRTWVFHHRAQVLVTAIRNRSVLGQKALSRVLDCSRRF